jgi:uncharacterized damage-inducible protein DinB
MTSEAEALSAALAAALTSHLELFARRARELAEPLTADEFWTKPYPYGNSVGHLLLHVTGNLNYYVGTQIAGTGYVRDRPLEFADTTRRPPSEVLGDLDRAVAMVTRTIQDQTAASWVAAYDAAGTNETTRVGMVLRCVEHFFHHVGQVIYLVKQHQTVRPR